MTDTKELVHTRIVALQLCESITLQGEHTTPRLGHNCDAILPACLGSNGVPRALEKGDAPQGFLLSKRVPSREGRPAFVAQTFVPMANVRAVTYGE